MHLLIAVSREIMCDRGISIQKWILSNPQIVPISQKEVFFIVGSFIEAPHFIFAQ
jgi:hypothetical protein